VVARIANVASIGRVTNPAGARRAGGAPAGRTNSSAAELATRIPSSGLDKREYTF
jgi:hypothetical protein